MSAIERIQQWQQRGQLVSIGKREIFVVDVAPAPASGSTGSDTPLLVLHGFPTSSIDFDAVLPALSAGRRVVLFDFLGFGMSSKPDHRYSLLTQADVAAAVVAHLGLDRVDLLTHDIGDSVGGELLARSNQGALGFEIGRRVLANGSIYYDLTQFTDGQKFLLDLPDDALPVEQAPDVDTIVGSLQGTFAPPGGDASHPDPDLVRAGADLVMLSGGNRLLPRTIRYIEDRKEHGDRWSRRHRDPRRRRWPWCGATPTRSRCGPWSSAWSAGAPTPPSPGWPASATTRWSRPPTPSPPRCWPVWLLRLTGVRRPGGSGGWRAGRRRPRSRCSTPGSATRRWRSVRPA